MQTIVHTKNCRSRFFLQILRSKKKKKKTVSKACLWSCDSCYSTPINRVWFLMYNAQSTTKVISWRHTSRQTISELIDWGFFCWFNVDSERPVNRDGHIIKPYHHQDPRIQYSDRILQNCLTPAPERKHMCPSGADSKDQLLGNNWGLITTVQFIKNVNIPVWVMTKKHLNAEEDLVH